MTRTWRSYPGLSHSWVNFRRRFKAFMDDLGESGLSQRVLLMTF